MRVKFLFMAFCAISFSFTVNAQGPSGSGQAPGDNLNGGMRQHAYLVHINNENDSLKINNRNEQLANNGVVGSRRGLADLGSAVANSYKSVLVQKTVNATSNLISLGVTMLTTAININKANREEWLEMAKKRCEFEENLSTQVAVEDFYYGRSTCGALDPMNMKFNGFSCKGFLKPVDEGGKPAGPQHEKKDDNSSTNAEGLSNPNEEIIQPSHSDPNQMWEFYVACKLRDDSEGLQHMANHSKFYLELDTLLLDTRHMSLLNDSKVGIVQQKFDFNKRKDLTFRINVKFYSSWVNEAVMITDNQKIGEFNITAKIDSSMVKDSVFVFDKTDPHHLESVSMNGDCFLVPRSYTGTASSPSWGSGQYRMEITVYEKCAINEDYYKEGYDEWVESVGNGREIAFANTPGSKRWDKEKWQAEWNEMHQCPKGVSVWKRIWESVKVAYIGQNWVQEIVSPAANAIYDQEAKSLNELLGITSEIGVNVVNSAGDNAGSNTGSNIGGNVGNESIVP